MGRKKKLDIGGLVKDMKQGIVSSNSSSKTYIPSIVEFIQSPKYLGYCKKVNKNSIELHPAQMIALKVFYRGSPGNEHVELDKKELAFLTEVGLFKDSELDKGSVLEKYESNVIFNELVLVWGRRCLSENATIIDPKNGSLNTIADLYDKGQKTISSWTYNEKANKMEEVKNADIIYQGEREVFKIVTSSGHEIEATSNHPFLTKDGWKNVKDLTNEDFVAVAEEIPFFGYNKEISEDEAAILGYMTADGNCSQSSTFFTCDNSEILDDFEKRLNNISENLVLFNDPWTKASSAKNQYKITSKRYVSESFYCEKRNRKFTRRAKNDLMKLLAKWGLAGKTCHHKCVPLELFKCPKEVISSYLKALFSCDGNLHTDTKGRRSMLELTTVNKKQAQLVQMLLGKYGIIAKIRKKKVNSTITDEKGTIKTYNTHCYVLSFSRKKYLEIFLKEIGLTGKDEYVNISKSFLKTVDGNIKTNHLDDHPYSYFKIKTIKNVGTKRTFDLSVSDQSHLQNFVSNSFICHNSGKDFLVGIIALYEACRLLEMSNGDPYAFYGISDTQEISILTVAGAAEQAAVAFREIEGKFFDCKYFEDKYIAEGITGKAIHILTKRDKEENAKRKEKGLSAKKGSICIEVGHSNSSSLRGKGIYVCILDEVAFYKTTSGSSSGDQIYQGLAPAVKTFIRRVPILDENGDQEIGEDGKPKEQKFFDGKIIAISSPCGEEGLLWNLFSKADNAPQRLAFRMPTWEVNLFFTRDDLKKEFPDRNEEEFNMEFGSEFSGSAGSTFFVKEMVDKAFNPGFKIREVSQPGWAHFFHLDPATSSHNYALCGVHKEIFIKDSKQDFRIVVDMLKFWHPDGKAIPVSVVDNYVLNLRNRFHIIKLTYDQHRSENSINLMRKNGMPAMMTNFHSRFKMKIYQELYNLLAEGKIIIPDDGSEGSRLLKQEMYNLQRKDTYQGWKVFPSKDAETRTDDLVDALAASVFQCRHSMVESMPQGVLINIEGDGRNRVWQGMQGPIGQGSGQQISQMRENINSWPQKFR